MPLATIGNKQLEFYTKNDLVVKSKPHDKFKDVYTLKFEPKIKDEDSVRLVEYKESRCVISGKTENLSMHHIVPYFIRQHFPEEYKSRKSDWCVLLERSVHDEVEDVYNEHCQKKWVEYLKNHTDYKDFRIYERNQFSDEAWNKIPFERRYMLSHKIYDNFYRSLEFSNVDECVEILRERWIMQFIDEHGGYDGVHEYFKEIFMKFKPKYLPKYCMKS